MGVQVYACRLENSAVAVSYHGIGQCLFESLKYNFKKKKSSTVLFWVLNKEGQYLPPLKLEWKNTHTGWWKFSNEFLFLALEGLQGRFIKKEDIYLSNREKGTCLVAEIPNRDLGNFIGDLTLTIPKGRRLTEYFNVSALEHVRTERVSLSVRVPFYLNKKRAYKAKIAYTSDKAEIIEISVLTNFNLITQRDFCISGNFNIQQPVAPTRVTP